MTAHQPTQPLNQVADVRAQVVAEMAEAMRPLLVRGRELADKNIAPHLPTNADLLHRLLDDMFAVSHGYPVSSQFYAQAQEATR